MINGVEQWAGLPALSGFSAGHIPELIAASPPQEQLPQLIDITDSTGIRFDHLSSPEQKYIVESMSGGVALIDYDRDGWPDLLVTCFGGVVLYRNNGDGTFTDVTKQTGLSDESKWATGAAFGDYDGDGWDDLFVAHYVDFHLDDLPAFGSSQTCKFRGIDVQCGPRGLKKSSCNLYHNNHDGTFTDVSKKAGIADSPNSFGLTAVWSDFDGDGHLDLFLANDAGRNYLYQNDGSGHFTDIGFAAGVAVRSGRGGTGQHGCRPRRLPEHRPLFDRGDPFQ